MARFFSGTTGNDIIDGSGFDRDVFSDIGYGRDTVTGGSNSDVFHMRVDKGVDHVDGGAGRDLIDYIASDVQLNIDDQGLHATDLMPIHADLRLHLEAGDEHLRGCGQKGAHARC